MADRGSLDDPEPGQSVGCVSHRYGRLDAAGRAAVAVPCPVAAASSGVSVASAAGSRSGRDGSQSRSETAHGMWSNNRPAGTSSASARSTIVGKRGARIPRSTFEIAVVCRPVARDRSSWDQPRSARIALRLAAKRSSGLTADSFRVLAQEAKRHIVNLESQSIRRLMRDLRSEARSMLVRRVPWLACRIEGCGSTLENCDEK